MIKQLPNLTSLRFFLAFIVILYHLPQYCQNRDFPFFNNFSIFNKGKEAVLVFFSLSGFLIIRNLILEKEKKGFVDLKKFYIRRVLRILPLYYLILTIGFVFYHLIAPQFGFVNGSNYNLTFGILLGVTFFANILASFKPGGIIEILWSIGIEEQFYLFIAPILNKINLKRILTFLTIFTILYFLLFNFSPEKINFLKKYNMYFYHFSFSGIIAYISLKNKIKTHIIIKLAFFILFLLLFFTNIIIHLFNYQMYNLICMITFSITIWLLSEKEIPFLNNVFLVHLGKISYGIYMYHVLMFQLIGYFFIKFKVPSLISKNQSIILFYSSVIILTIIISHFSYKYFESYFIKLKKQ